MFLSVAIAFFLHCINFRLNLKPGLSENWNWNHKDYIQLYFSNLQLWCSTVFSNMKWNHKQLFVSDCTAHVLLDKQNLCRTVIPRHHADVVSLTIQRKPFKWRTSLLSNKCFLWVVRPTKSVQWHHITVPHKLLSGWTVRWFIYNSYAIKTKLFCSNFSRK